MEGIGEREKASFNGALLFRARKPVLAEAYAQVIGASMGPYSFEQGNQEDNMASQIQGRASMGPYSFEQGNKDNRVASCALIRSFNGALLFRARKLASGDG